MTPSATRVARIKAQSQLQLGALEAARGIGSGAKDIAIEMVRNPLLSMVAAVVSIELLQNVRITDYNTGPIPVFSGQSHVIIGWQYPKKQLLSQGLATTMETAIISAETIKALGGLGGIAGLIGSFAK